MKLRALLLGDVVRFGNGKSIKPGGAGAYPVYGSNGVIGASDEYRHENGVIIGRVGAYCGSIAYCRGRFWASDNTLVAFPASQEFDTKFLFYLLVDAKLSRYAGGAAQPLVTQTVLKGAKVHVPPLPIQHRVAGILSAYDDLIQNNQRRIETLETLARLIYREWFVEFRFPGHEKVKLVASPLGQIPHGWQVKKLSEVAEVNRAQISARTAPDELHYIDISSVSPDHIDSITTYTFADAPGRARRIVQHGDVLWSCVRPNRRSHAPVMHPETNTIASTGFAVLTAKTVPFTFLYAATTTDDFVGYLTNNASGAAYPAVTAETFEKAELIIPPAAWLKRYNEVSTAIAEQAHTLQRQLHNLCRTRDLLLPRLLSGQIDLSKVSREEQLAA